MIEASGGESDCIAIMSDAVAKQATLSSTVPSNGVVENQPQLNATTNNDKSGHDITPMNNQSNVNEDDNYKQEKNQVTSNFDKVAISNNTNDTQNTNVEKDNSVGDEENTNIKNKQTDNEEEEEEEEEDLFADLEVATLDLYDISNYTFGKKSEESKCKMLGAIPSEKLSITLEQRYSKRGMRRSVAAVVVIHSHNFPHVLLLQRHDGKGEFALPGGRLRPGESDEEGLMRKLRSKLYPIDDGTNIQEDDDEEQQLDIGEKLGNWYAIDFSRRYYPYVPAHITKPKEVLHVYAVSLPRIFKFAVPKNLQLIAVPLFELYNNSAIYGDVISAIPALLSRYHINYC